MSTEASKISPYQNNARIAGVLFIIGTVAGILSGAFAGPVLGSPDYLEKLSANENQVVIAAFFIFVMAIACASIAISLYPVLRQYSEALALGAVGFRLIEGVLMIFVVISILSLLALSQEFVHAGAPASSYFQTIGVIVKAGYDWVNSVGMLMAWCIGALMYYYIFYQTRLIPRWISGWGLAGVVLCMIASMAVMFGLIGADSTTQSLMNIPIGLQEMVMAVWLIVKGFNTSAITSGCALPKQVICQ